MKPWLSENRVRQLLISNTSQSRPSFHLILNVHAGRLSFLYFFLFSLVSTSVFVLLIFLLTPGFAPLAGQNSNILHIKKT
jgi:hypothetical protein